MEPRKQEGWPVLRVTGNLAMNHGLPDQPRPPEAALTEYETYYPASAVRHLVEAVGELLEQRRGPAHYLPDNGLTRSIIAELEIRLATFNQTTKGEPSNGD